MCASADQLATSLPMHRHDDVNALSHQHRLHRQLPPMPHAPQPPYLVQPDVDNELLSLFMVASSEDDPGIQWAATAGAPPIPQQSAAKPSARLARKAELARASRLRKKQYISDLEQRVRQLKEAVAEAQDRVRRASNALRIPSAAGPLRRSGQYLDLASQCITPSVPVKFAIWSLDQPPEFYNQPGLWHSLLEGEIGLDSDQLSALRARQMSIRSLRQSMAHTKTLGERVRSECHRIDEQISEESANFQAILTPQQVNILQRWAASTHFSVDVANAAPVR